MDHLVGLSLWIRQSCRLLAGRVTSYPGHVVVGHVTDQRGRRVDRPTVKLMLSPSSGVFEVSRSTREGSSSSRPLQTSQWRRKFVVALYDGSQWTGVLYSVCCGSWRRHGPRCSLSGSLGLHVAAASLWNSSLLRQSASDAPSAFRTLCSQSTGDNNKLIAHGTVIQSSPLSPSWNPRIFSTSIPELSWETVKKTC